jgi:cytochrome c-type biogenesis protein CcmH/NrfG
MASQSRTAQLVNPPGLSPGLTYAIAGFCFLFGVILGYFVSVRNTAWPSAQVQAGATPVAAPAPGMHPKLTLEQMKQMADVQASALLEKSKADPKNTALLVQIATIYQSTHQFKQAAGYFENALKIEPKNVPARTQLATCLYYSGDVDGALSQLTRTLKYDPADTNALFNLGMIKYRGKNDARGAIVDWQRLLKLNLEPDRKEAVEKMIAEAQTASAEKK